MAIQVQQTSPKQSEIVFSLPEYEHPPKWIPLNERRYHPDYSTDVRKFLPRTVELKRRDNTERLGFNIRGGSEYGSAVYISRVLPGTEADRLGLREGDQLLSVNDVSCADMKHGEVVELLQRYHDILLTVRFFPFGYYKTYEQKVAPGTPQKNEVPVATQQQSDASLEPSGSQYKGMENKGLDGKLYGNGVHAPQVSHRHPGHRDQYHRGKPMSDIRPPDYPMTPSYQHHRSTYGHPNQQQYGHPNRHRDRPVSELYQGQVSEPVFARDDHIRAQSLKVKPAGSPEMGSHILRQSPPYRSYNARQPAAQSSPLYIEPSTTSQFRDNPRVTSQTSSIYGPRGHPHQHPQGHKEPLQYR